MQRATAEDLKAIERLLAALPEKQLRDIQNIPLISDEIRRGWQPNPGPQTMALESEAHLLLYGGAAGGGKSCLLIGCAARNHKQSLILRRKSVELDGLIEESQRVLGDKGQYNKVEKRWTFGKGCVMQFGGCKDADDWRDYAGRARDYIGIDEAAEFMEEQVSSLMAWLRSTDPDQRCRVVLASNPPRGAEGEWVIRWFAPWIDPLFPDPAAPGELRWCYRVRDDIIWCDGPGEYEHDGERYTAQSRTFIPAKVTDNPALGKTYIAELQNKPEPLRSQLLHGDFTAGREDDEWQAIPSAWVIAAQDRWTEDGWREVQQTAMALDCAGGGKDAAVLAYRYGGWFAKLESVSGEITADGAYMASLVMRHRKHGSPVVVDVGGGYAGAVIERFKDNGIAYQRFDGGAKTSHTSVGTNLKFFNKRAEAWWRMREALDPEQEGGAQIALPPDPQLRADLVSPRYEVKSGELRIEEKAAIIRRLGRSPDRGDAVVMCLSEGDRVAMQRLRSLGRGLKVHLGYQHAKRRR